jgi:DNA excision repair protein ERCC-2
MKTIEVAVKEVAQYVFSSGDLNVSSQRLQREVIGQKIHAHRQSLYPSDTDSEVLIEGTYDLKDVTYHLRGRMDGLFKSPLVIEEIKSTLLDTAHLKAPMNESHLLQLKIYCYLYMKKHDLKTIEGRLLYIEHPSLKETHLNYTFSFEMLDFEVETALETHYAWAKLMEAHQHDKSERFQAIAFPFEAFREGQETFVSSVYETFLREGLTLIEAPTGIGKTAAALHGALSGVKSPDDKIMYVTAKMAGQKTAVDALSKFQGLTPIKTIRLHAKERLCLRDEVDCDPEICPFAKGYYDRVQGALKELYLIEEGIDSDILKAVGLKHQVCPHELALDYALIADVVVADYNYAFDPRIQLVRFFEDQARIPKLLVDEAHNLVDRGQAMYSASISLEKISRYTHALKEIKPSPMAALSALLKALEKEKEHALVNHEPSVFFKDLPENLSFIIETAITALEPLLQKHKFHPLRPVFRELFFELIDFLRIEHYFDEAFVYAVHFEKEDVRFAIECLDPSGPLKETLVDQSRGAVLFSATLEPVHYFQHLIARGHGQTLKLPSPFPHRNLEVLIDNAPMKYHDRLNAIPRIIDTLIALFEMGPVHSISYFPSYAFMRQVEAAFNAKGYDLTILKPEQTALEKEALFNHFKEEATHHKMLWTVLGGSYAEGVELPDNRLKAVFIMGVALPQVSLKKDLEKHRFEQIYQEGFHYAYTYPGMTKVIQAVGRLIRKDSDIGLAILMDERYITPVYQALFPPQWEGAKILEQEDYVQGYLDQFFKKFK